MIEISLNALLKEVDGKEVPNTTLAKVLSKRLAYASDSGNPVKMYDWATQLWSKGVINVDRTDYDFIKDFVEKDKELLVFAKAQVMLSMKESLNGESANKEVSDVPVMKAVKGEA